MSNTSTLVVWIMFSTLALSSLPGGQNEERTTGCAFRKGIVNAGSEGLIPPLLIKKSDPEYPKSARAAKAGDGTVFLCAEIDRSGVPRNLRVLSSTHPSFEEEALIAIKKWRFRPGNKNGKPVVGVGIDLNFRLLRSRTARS